MTFKDMLILFNGIQVAFLNTLLLERILAVTNIALYLTDKLFNILKELVEQRIAREINLYSLMTHMYIYYGNML